MRAKTILALLFVVSLCVVVILGLRALPQRVNGDAAPAKDEMLVSTRALSPGTLLRAKDVIWQQVADTGEPGYILRPADVGGKPNLERDQSASTEFMAQRCALLSRLVRQSVAVRLLSRAIAIFFRLYCPPGLERSRSQYRRVVPAPAFCIPAIT